MSEASDERVWDVLCAVHEWLVSDLIHKINHASHIVEDDFEPFFTAYKTLDDEQFRMDSRLYHLSNEALIDNLHKELLRFVATTNQMIEARDSGDEVRRAQLNESMGTQYNSLVEDYRQRLHMIGAVLTDNRRRPLIGLPSLQYVGGGIVINSPNTHQDTRSAVSRTYTVNGGQIRGRGRQRDGLAQRLLARPTDEW